MLEGTNAKQLTNVAMPQQPHRYLFTVGSYFAYTCQFAFVSLMQSRRQPSMALEECFRYIAF